MSRFDLNNKRFRRPELYLYELLRAAASGELDRRGLRLERADVVCVDVRGGRLENETADGDVAGVGGELFRANHGPTNPPNSVKARIVTDLIDGFLSDAELRVFWPLFPPEHMMQPVKAGEQVTVVFDDDGRAHGIWLARTPGLVGAGVAKAVDGYTRLDTTGRRQDLFGTRNNDDGTARPVHSPGYRRGRDLFGRVS